MGSMHIFSCELAFGNAVTGNMRLCQEGSGRLLLCISSNCLPISGAGYSAACCLFGSPVLIRTLMRTTGYPRIVVFLLSPGCQGIHQTTKGLTQWQNGAIYMHTSVHHKQHRGFQGWCTHPLVYIPLPTVRARLFQLENNQSEKQMDAVQTITQNVTKKKLCTVQSLDHILFELLCYVGNKDTLLCS